MDPKNSANKKTVADLDVLSQEAINIAKNSGDVEKMLKAVHLNDSLDALKYNTRDSRWFRVGQIIAPYTAIFALVLSLLTLGQQYSQFAKSQDEQRKSAERTQWRDALKSLSFKDDASVLSSSLQLQTFFDVPDYASMSRSSATKLLPLLGQGSHFDIIWKGIIAKTDEGNQHDLITVAQEIGSEEFWLFQKVTGKKFSPDKVADMPSFIDFLVDPSRPERGWTNERGTSAGASSFGVTSSDSEYVRDGELNPIKRATASAWKLSTITQSLQYLWSRKELTPGGVDLNGVILLDGDLSGIDFSKSLAPPSIIHHCNLTGASFERMRLDQIVITQPTGFKDSKWGHANWWDAGMLSCELAQYLMDNFAPSDPGQKGTAQSLVAQSCRK